MRTLRHYPALPPLPPTHYLYRRFLCSFQPQSWPRFGVQVSIQVDVGARHYSRGDVVLPCWRGLAARMCTLVRMQFRKYRDSVFNFNSFLLWLNLFSFPIHFIFFNKNFRSYLTYPWLYTNYHLLISRFEPGVGYFILSYRSGWPGDP